MASSLARKFLKQVRNNILAGIFLIIPVGGSLFIVYKLLDWADKALPTVLGMHWASGLGILISLMVAYLLGLLAKNWVGKKIIATGNAIIVSIPFLSKIYLIIKQIIDTVTADKRKLFERAVLLEFPRKECFVIGLVTSGNNANFSTRAGRKLVAVFVPHAPNPTSGFLLYVPEEDCVDLDIPIESALKLVISGGILGSEIFGEDQKLPTTTKHWNWTDIFKWKSRKTGSHNHNDPRD